MPALSAPKGCRLLLVLLSLGPMDQKPDFSGTWAAKQLSFDAHGVTGGSVMRIEQTADVIRIRRTYGRESIRNPPVVLSIKLDGSDSPNPYHGVHREGLTGTITSKAKWDGARLIIVTTRTMTDATARTTTKSDMTETFSVDGTQLTVERTVSPGNIKPRKDVWWRQ